MISTDRRFIVFTWGCQMNEDDSEQISSLLMGMGYSPTMREDEADIAVLVTCSVRAKPEDKAKSKLGELRILKQQRPDMIIGVCGCMAQRVGESLRKHRPYVDFVLGTDCISELPAIIIRVDEQRRFVASLDLPSRDTVCLASPTRTSRLEVGLKCFVPIMYGCDNFCSYCIVPYVRGRERSRAADEVLAEVRDLVVRGCREVTLLGQNVNSYGAGLADSCSFPELLQRVSEVDGIQRVRFTTSHPKDLSDKLIDAMARLPKVCEHIHLAVQSGDDDILGAMNRRYTVEHIEERVRSLRTAVPGISITTDLIVGFPGETEEQFEHTIELVERVRFDAAFMFAFNPIPETAAASLPGQLSSEVKNTRLRRLIEIQNRITCELNADEVGEVFEVLVEGPSPRDASRMTGLTRKNKTVSFPSNRDLTGSVASVRATKGRMYGFEVEIIEVKEP